MLKSPIVKMLTLLYFVFLLSLFLYVKMGYVKDIRVYHNLYLQLSHNGGTIDAMPKDSDSYFLKNDSLTFFPSSKLAPVFTNVYKIDTNLNVSAKKRRKVALPSSKVIILIDEPDFIYKRDSVGRPIMKYTWDSVNNSTKMELIPDTEVQNKHKK